MAKNKISLTYQVVTNLSCNLDCEYCYERKYPRNNNITDAVDFIHACFDRDKHLPDVSVVIDIIGGEPMLQPKQLIAIFETAEELAKRDGRDYVFSISTNATLFDKPLCREIVERWKDVLSIGVSIDGLPEMHDKYRIFTTTREGSYEQVIRGYNYLKSVGLRELGVKATFTKETMVNYAASMKHVIDVTGGGTVSGNVVFEDVLERSMAMNIANQMIEVIDYWFEKGLHKNPRNQLTHVIPEGLNFDSLWNPDYRQQIVEDLAVRLDSERVRPFCGAVKYMTCLGFDRNIYGCNRFMSTGAVINRQAIGKLVGREIVTTDDNRLLNEVSNQYTEFSETCLKCPFKPMCGNCSAAPYENGAGEFEDRKAYHAERRQCGWTVAKMMVAEYFRRKTGTYDVQQLHDDTQCYCTECERKRTQEQLKQKVAKDEVNSDSQFYSL